jgi:hypothetical protein
VSRNCIPSDAVMQEKREVIDVNVSWVGRVAVPLPQCLECKHLNRETLKCPAFGDKPIPDDIQLNLSDHRYPYPSDRGIQFEDRLATTR